MFNKEGENMGELKIKWPTCNSIIGTGISMDKQSFESSTLANNQVNCPVCGSMVTWNKEDVISM